MEIMTLTDSNCEGDDDATRSKFFSYSFPSCLRYKMNKFKHSHPSSKLLLPILNNFHGSSDGPTE